MGHYYLHKWEKNNYLQRHLAFTLFPTKKMHNLAARWHNMCENAVCPSQLSRVPLWWPTFLICTYIHTWQRQGSSQHISNTARACRQAHLACTAVVSFLKNAFLTDQRKLKLSNQNRQIIYQYISRQVVIMRSRYLGKKTS